MKKTIWLLLALVLTISNYVAAQSPSSFKRSEIMRYFKRPASQSDDLWPIVAHRGYWRGASLNSTGKYYPENSLSAITRAHNSGIEAVELDVRTTSDKVPVLIHDLTIGRTTGANFNPMNCNGNENYYVNQLTLSQIRTYSLRAWNTAVNGKAVSSSLNPYEDVPTVYQAVRHVIDNNLKVILIFDIFSAEDLKLTFNKVKEAGGLDFVAFKIGSGGKSIGNYKDVYKSMGLIDANGNRTKLWQSFNLAIILYEDSNQEMFNFYYDALAHVTNDDNLVFVEPVYKQAINQNDLPKLYHVAQTLQTYKLRTGHYLTVPGAVVRNYQGNMQGGYFTSSGWGTNIQTGLDDLKPGGCCTSPYSYLENLDNLLQPFRKTYWSDGGFSDAAGFYVYPDGGSSATVITSDDVEKLKTNFAQKGKRNTNWYKCGAATCPSGLRIINDTARLSIVAKDVLHSIIDGEVVTVFPNPVQNELRISFNAVNVADVQISLTSMEGRVLMQQQYKATIGNNVVVVNTQVITNGIYLVRVQIGTQLITKKVVVSK
jgi:Glycerophosphoryl diester phosphodiesterase family/Secretion system C-terminal sorting domain